jgi:hypothetical protein
MQVYVASESWWLRVINLKPETLIMHKLRRNNERLYITSISQLGNLDKLLSVQHRLALTRSPLPLPRIHTIR